MASRGQSDVQDIRRRLQMTEKTLHELEGIEFLTSTPQGGNSVPSSPGSDRNLKLQELTIGSEKGFLCPQNSSKLQSRRVHQPQGRTTHSNMIQQQPGYSVDNRGRHYSQNGLQNEEPFKEPKPVSQSQGLQHVVYGSMNDVRYYRDTSETGISVGRDVNSFKNQGPYNEKSSNEGYFLRHNQYRYNVDQAHTRGHETDDKSDVYQRSRNSLDSAIATQQSRGSSLNQNLSAVSSSSSAVLDSDKLRARLHQVREENARLVQHNHQLMNELEDTDCNLQRTNAKADEAYKEVASLQHLVTSLESKVKRCSEEANEQAEALRSAEDRIEASQLKLLDVEDRESKAKIQIEKLREQLAEANKQWQRAEHERDKSLESAEQMQQSYMSFQERSKSRVSVLEQREHELEEALKQAHLEHNDLITKLHASDELVTQLKHKIRKYKDGRDQDNDILEKMEQDNQDLRQQLNQQAEKMGEYEGEIRSCRHMKTENQDLWSLVESQKSKLAQYAKTLQEYKHQIEDLNNESKRKPQYSKKTDGKRPQDTNELQKLKLQIGDLRLEVSRKELEISELRSIVENRTTDTPNKALEGVKKELQSVLERNKDAEKRNSSLESAIEKLENERSKHVAQILSLEEQLGDLDVKRTSYDARLAQRTNQVTELQKELTQQTNQITVLERELRKKTGQLSSLERELDDKVSQVTEHISRLSELEDQVQTKSLSLTSLRRELDEKNRVQQRHDAEVSEMKQLHVEQCEELTQQIEVLQQKVQQLTVAHTDADRTISNLKQDLQYKDSTFNEVKNEMSSRVAESAGRVRALEGQLKDMETALMVCQEQLDSSMAQFTQIREQHDRDMDAKQSQLAAKEKHLSQMNQSLSSKEEEIGSLKASIEAGQKMVEQAEIRVGELEDGNTGLQKRVSELEKEVQKLRSKTNEEQTNLKQEVVSLEKKLHAACRDVEKRTKLLKDTENKHKALLSEKQRLEGELSEQERLLQQERGDGERRQQEADDLRQQLRQETRRTTDLEEHASELEDNLRRTQDELHDKALRAAEFYDQLTQVQKELQITQAEVEETQHCLNDTQLQLTRRENQVEELNQKLRRAQDELRSKNNEIEELQSFLKERQWELQQRAAQLTQLDMTVKGHRTEMEQKIISLETTLQKSQLELAHRNKQVHDLEQKLSESLDQIERLETGMRESGQREQGLAHQVQGVRAQGTELEKQLEQNRQQLEAANEQNVELNKQLRIHKESHQKAEFELAEVQREKSKLERELERVLQEHQEAHQVIKVAFQTKEAELARLMEDLNIYHAKETMQTAQAKTHIERSQMELTQARGEIKKLQKEMQNMEESYKRQISELEEAHRKLEAVGSTVSAREQALSGELEAARAALAEMEGELMAHRHMIDAANHTIVLKDAELARLEGRMAGFNRAKQELAANSSLMSSLALSQTSANQTRISDVSHDLENNTPYNAPMISSNSQAFSNIQNQQQQLQQQQQPQQQQQLQLQHVRQSQSDIVSGQRAQRKNLESNDNYSLQEISRLSLHDVMGSDSSTSVESTIEQSPNNRVFSSTDPILNLRPVVYSDIDEIDSEKSSSVVTVLDASDLARDPDSFQAMLKQVSQLGNEEKNLQENALKIQTSNVCHVSHTSTASVQNVGNDNVYTSSPKPQKQSQLRTVQGSSGSNIGSKSVKPSSSASMGTKRSQKQNVKSLQTSKSHQNFASATYSSNAKQKVQPKSRKTKTSPNFRSKSPNVSTAMSRYASNSNVSYQSDQSINQSSSSNAQLSETHNSGVNESVENLLLSGKGVELSDTSNTKISRSTSYPDKLDNSSTGTSRATNQGLTPQTCLAQLHEKTAALQQKQQELDRHIYGGDLDDMSPDSDEE